MTFCAIGGRPITTGSRRVVTEQRPEGMTLCAGHGIACEAAEDLIQRLAPAFGDDHPFVVTAYKAFDEILREPCPERVPAEVPALDPLAPPPIDADTRAALDRYAIGLAKGPS